MGTICAPAHANIFMTEFEQNDIYLFIKQKSIFSYAKLIILYGMNQIWKTAKRFYEWNESKTSLYKVQLQICLQVNKVPRYFSQ